MNKYAGIIWVCFMAISVCHGQTNLEYQKQTFVHEEDTLMYRILLPEGLRNSNKYPLILFLHGAGERGNDNEKQLIHGSQLFLDSTRLSGYQSVVIFPQCPQNSYWSNVERSVDTQGKREFKFISGQPPTVPMRLVLSLLDSMKALPFVDPQKIYIGGLSMGGMGTFEILSRRPNTFAAAFPICGGGDAQNVSGYANNVNLWVFHGALDNVVAPELSQKMVNAIKESGGEVKFTLYPQANHNSWDNAFAEPELFMWLFSQKKDRL